MKLLRLLICIGGMIFLLSASGSAQEEIKTPPREVKEKKDAKGPPTLEELIARPRSEFAAALQIYEADRSLLIRTYTVPLSKIKQERMERFYAGWIVGLKKLDASKLSEEAKADYAKLESQLGTAWGQTLAQWADRELSLPLLPFASTIIDLEENRRKIEPVDPIKAAGIATGIVKQCSTFRKQLEKDLAETGKEKSPFTKSQALKAMAASGELQAALKTWHDFYAGYDPLFTWWMEKPFAEATAAIQEYNGFLKEFASKLADVTPPRVSSPPLPAIAPDADIPDLVALMKIPHSEMRAVIPRLLGGERGKGGRPGAGGNRPPEERSTSLKDSLASLDKIDFDKLSRTGQIDYLLLKNSLQSSQRRLDLQNTIRDQTASLLSFEKTLDSLASQAKSDEPAKELAILKEIGKSLEDGTKRVPEVNRNALGTALDRITELRTKLRDGFTKRKTENSDLEAARKDLDGAMQKFAATMRQELSRTEARDSSGINGRPIGKESLLIELKNEMIPYTPEELVQIAEKEYEWCEIEMKKASREMGFGDDWKQALEKVKTLHVEAGKQPLVIRDLSNEAVEYLRKNDLVTLPPVAVEGWRMIMMTPQRLFSPFFTGGEVISVAFPTNTMSHDAKLQSLRGNNVHFSRATVHHELIPGHHLQGYMASRYQTHRGTFSTPFFVEGWALYWEMVLYGKGFPKTAEDRVGFLFWRMHRCARIVFSLNYHLGKMSPQDCIEYLVKKVGHERDNATAEVRRSFTGGYPPLYQAAYMLGGLQLRELRNEYVLTGKMTDRDFHDLILKQAAVPIVAIRAAVSSEKLTKDGFPEWKFYGKEPGKRSVSP